MGRGKEFTEGQQQVKPRVHPDNQLVGEPHYFDPLTTAWVEREPPTIYRTGGRKTPRWAVHHLKANTQGGSMQTSSESMRSRKAALAALEAMKADPNIAVSDFDRRGNVKTEWQEFRRKHFT